MSLIPSLSDLQDEINSIDTELDLKMDKSANLSDVDDVIESRANIGIGTGSIVLNLNQDYVLTNPPTKNIIINMAFPNHTVNLAPAGVPGGLEEGEFVTIISQPLSESILVQDSAGAAIVEVNGNEEYIVEYVGITLAPGTGWFSRKISGSGATPTMQDTYNAGSTIDMTDGQPIVINAGETVIGAQQVLVTPYSAGFYAAPASTTVYGISFTQLIDGYVTYLGYADTAFSSGTREVGLYQYLTASTGTLLGTATVAKTDPLDPATGKWRMSVLGSPIPVSANVRYVLAPLNPTTDQYLFYQCLNPNYAKIDGSAYPGLVSPVLAYPPITNYLGSSEMGNANLIFQSSLEEPTTLSFQDSTISSCFSVVDTTIQSCRPFGSMNTTQGNAIPAADVSGAVWYDNVVKQIKFSDGTNWVGLMPDFLVGGFTFSVTLTGNTAITLPTSGTLADDSTVVHNTGDETIDGIKTFTSPINLSSLSPNAVLGIDPLNAVYSFTTAGKEMMVTDGDGNPFFSTSFPVTMDGNITGNSGTSTALQTARNIGGVSFDGTANIVPQTIESSNEGTDTTCFPLFITASGTQQLQPKNNASFIYNSNTNTLTVSISGNASTATALQTARTIGAVSFDGTANIVPQTIQTVDESSDTSCFLLFVTASGTQSLQPKNNSLLSYNSLLNLLQFAGLTLDNKGAALSGTNNILFFPSSLSDGNYANFGGAGNWGKNSSGSIFYSQNLDWDATTNSYKYINSAAACVIELTSTGILLKTAPSGTAANAVTPTLLVSIKTDGTILYAGAQATTPVTVTSTSNSVATNAALSNNFVHTLTENTTLANPTNLVSGGTYTWKIVQDSTARTLNFGALFKWPGGVAMTVSTGSGQIDVITSYYDGTSLLSVYSQAFA